MPRPRLRRGDRRLAAGWTLTAGTETLTGDNLYSGATTINGGTLKLSGTGSIAASPATSSTTPPSISRRPAGASIKTLSGTGNVTLGAQTLTLSKMPRPHSAGRSTAPAGLTLEAAGTETLTGDNLYSRRDHDHRHGTLTLSGTGSIAASSDGAIDGRYLRYPGDLGRPDATLLGCTGEQAASAMPRR